MSALLKTRAAAAYLNVSRHQIEAWVREGRLVPVTLPGLRRWRFDLETLDAFVASAKAGHILAQSETTEPVQERPELATNGRGPQEVPQKRHTYERGWHQEFTK